MGQVPRVGRVPEQVHTADGELGGTCLPEHDHPGFAQSHDVRRVLLGHEVEQRAGVRGGPDTFRPADIFMRYGEAMQRTAPPSSGHVSLCRARGLERCFATHRDIAVKDPVVPVDAGEQSGHDFDGRHPPAFDHLGQGGQRHPLELGSNLDGGLRSGLHRIHPAPPNDVTVVRSDRTMSRVVSAENERHSSFSHRIQIFRAEREHPAGNRAE